MENPVTELRHNKGITRRELAIQTEMAYVTLTNIELGHPKTIQNKTAQKLAEFFHVQADGLVHWYSEWRKSLVK